MARIDKTGGNDLGLHQRRKFDAFIERYAARTRKSKEYTQANRRHMADPRVVNGFKPMLKEMTYQIVVERSKGSHLWDLDGNEIGRAQVRNTVHNAHIVCRLLREKKKNKTNKAIQ